MTIDVARLMKLADELAGCEVWPDIEQALREAARLLEEPRLAWVPGVCGTFRNGPEKQFVRCDGCHEVDFEANEGDKHRREGVGSYQTLVTDHGEVSLEARPDYCDRGSFIARVHPKHHLGCGACCVDEADAFPRYYFDERRAIEAWAYKRQWVRRIAAP